MSDAVLLMAYGSPETPEDIPAYYTHIRGGRPPSPELLAELIGRYQAIGGRSPLGEITFRQTARLEEALAARGRPIPVFVGMKHAPPFIGDVVRTMADAGVVRAVALALVPHYSRLSVAGYLQAAAEAAPPRLLVVPVERWGDHPGFVRVVAARLRAALDGLGALPPSVIFTAHSLPERILSWGDPYPEELRRSADAAARAAGIDRWSFAYQSAGRTPEPWLGPDLPAALRRLADERERAALVCPIGFVADHLEVLYDIDVEARALARDLGMRLERTAMPNDDPDFIAVLTDLVEARLGQAVS